MVVFRRRRGHLLRKAIAAINNFLFANDAETDQYYFDDAMTMPWEYSD